MTGNLTWSAGETTNYQRLFKAQFGSVFARDHNGVSTALNDQWNPFTSDGLAIDFTRLAAGGWINMGSCSENGIKFNPKFTNTDTKVWQTRMPVRSDVETDQDALTVEFMEATSAVDALFNDTPLTGRPADGSVGYGIVQKGVNPLFQRQVCVIGVDNQNGVEEYAAVTYALAQKDKKTGQQWDPKNVAMSPYDVTSYIDPFSGLARIFSRGGPGWINSATVGTIGTPTATAVTGAKATLSFTPPTGSASGITFTVQQFAGGSPTGAAATFTQTSAQNASPVLLSVTGLTVGTAYTFEVTATATNGSTVTSAQSNSVTAIT